MAKEVFDDERDSMFNEITIVFIIAAVTAFLIVVAMVLYQPFGSPLCSLATLKDKFEMPTNNLAAPTAPDEAEVPIMNITEKLIKMPPYYS